MRRHLYFDNRTLAKILVLVLTYLSFITYLTTESKTIYATDYYKSWCQSDPEWGSIYLGTSGENMSQIGCAVTAVAMLVVHSQSRSEKTINPGILCEYLSANGGFDSRGNIYWGAVTGLVDEFTFEKSTTFSGTTQAQKILELNNYISLGYYVIVGVKYGGHWVAIDYIKDNTVYIIDPASNQRTNLFNSYDNDEIIYIKLFKGIASTGTSPKKPGKYITTNDLNLRINASTYYTKIDLIPTGTEINVTAISGNWGEVFYNGKSGWVCLDYSELISEAETTITTPSITTPSAEYIPGEYKVIANSGLYYRSGPGVNYIAYGLLSYGTVVNVKNIEKGWGNISYNGYDAWISLEYAEFIEPEETTTITVTTPDIKYKIGEYKVIANSGLYYRSGPGITNTAYGILPYGTLVYVKNVENGWGNINYNGYDAWISLEYAEFNEPEETTTTTVEVTHPPVIIIKGDIDCDGKITIYDLSHLKRYIMNPFSIGVELFEAFDLNSDGYINSLDTKELSKILTNQ